MAKRLYVGNLPYTVGEDQLRSLFSQAGSVIDVHIPSDRETGRPRGFAFVEMATDAEAQQAIDQFDGTPLDNRQLRVNLAMDREAGSGGYGRRGR
jgi:cold-inducible RNA-binding protein